MAHVFERIVELQKAGQEAVLVTVVEKEGSGPLPAGARMLVYADGRTTGTVGGGALESIATQKALDLLRERKPRLERYVLSERNEIIEGEPTGMLCGGRVTLFYEYFGSSPRLYLFGGGHVGQALVHQLRNLDFHVTVIDEREGIEYGVAGADHVWVGDYHQALADEQVPGGGFFVIATPSHQFDYGVLRHILTSGWNPRYVGVLASRTKAAAFLQELRADLGVGVDLRALYMPIGLDVGGSSATEIAVSIVAELQAVRYGRGGLRHLRLEAPAG